MKYLQLLLVFLLAGFSLISPVFALPDPSIKEEKVEPIVILGGGVGALTSALYLSRAGVEPILLEGTNPGGLITQSHSVENWPGELEISGSELVGKIRKQVVANGATLRAEEVIAVDFSKRPFTITTRSVKKPDELRQIQAETCIIAMGTRSNYLGIPGETGTDGYWGRGVSNCAVCDGALYRDRVVGIVGGGDAAVLEGLYLSQIAREVYIFVRKDAFKAVETKRLDALLERPNVHVLYETEVTKIVGNEKQLTHLILKNNKEENAFKMPIDALFLAIGSRPNTELFQGVLQLDEAGYIQLYKDQQTSIEGVFAIGDIVDPVYKQASSAAGDGAKAAIQAQKHLFDRMGQLAMRKTNKKKMAVKNVVAQSNLPQKDIAIHSSSPSYLALADGIVEIRSKEHLDQELKNNQMPTVIDFYAPWCGPCQGIAPSLEDSAKNLSGKMKFLKIDVDKLYTLSQSYEITSMPTVLVLDANGSVIDRRVGPEAILDLLKKLDAQID